jgi:hypothetical protein
MATTYGYTSFSERNMLVLNGVHAYRICYIGSRDERMQGFTERFPR